AFGAGASPDVAAVAGALLGAAWGVDALPAAVVTRLELGRVMDELAQDLVRQLTNSPANDRQTVVAWQGGYPGWWRPRPVVIRRRAVARSGTIRACDIQWAGTTGRAGDRGRAHGRHRGGDRRAARRDRMGRGIHVLAGVRRPDALGPRGR